ncbi:uncharacterized protein LOC108678876 [Hyalella azteca]|uniref:Uncharacterized protein LOC108678876 n=1 Tax=Hyalella azteca TaxID=294128 RepID=A0A8B7PA54_HYAAZ|nr:uncharacterized protein LOC108678876 [Hyalella azteca]
MKSLHSQHCYFIVHMECLSNQPCPFSPEVLKVSLQMIVTERFGAAEACRDLEIMKMDKNDSSFILRVHEDSYAKLHCSIAMCDSLRFAGEEVRLKFIVQEPIVRSLPMLGGSLRQNPMTRA